MPKTTSVRQAAAIAKTYPKKPATEPKKSICTLASKGKGRLERAQPGHSLQKRVRLVQVPEEVLRCAGETLRKCVNDNVSIVNNITKARNSLHSKSFKSTPTLQDFFPNIEVGPVRSPKEIQEAKEMILRYAVTVEFDVETIDCTHGAEQLQE